jgi:predicted amidophosphoribosyltransferase
MTMSCRKCLNWFDQATNLDIICPDCLATMSDHDLIIYLQDRLRVAKGALISIKGIV